MKYRITMSLGQSTIDSEPLATTTDPILIRHVLYGLWQNWHLETDHYDRILSPSFLAMAQEAIAAIDEMTRRDAERLDFGEATEASHIPEGPTPQKSIDDTSSGRQAT